MISIEWQLGLVAFSASALLTPAVRSVAISRGLVAQPNPIVPQHREPVALFGGVAIALALGVSLAWLGSPESLAWAPGAAAYVAVGAIDDLHRLRPLPKLALQTFAAAAAAATSPAVDGLLDTLMATAAFVVAVNAVNLTDVCDGLVSGLACIACLAFVFVAPDRSLEAVAGAGACAGFWIWNRPPARIFLGDSGSQLLGFWLASLALSGAATIGGPRGVLTAVSIPAVFLFELVFLVVVRTRRGRPFWIGSPDHFSLRLQALGISRWATLVIASACGAFAGLAGVAIAFAPFAIALAAGIAIAGCAALAGGALARREA